MNLHMCLTLCISVSPAFRKFKETMNHNFLHDLSCHSYQFLQKALGNNSSCNSTGMQHSLLLFLMKVTCTFSGFAFSELSNKTTKKLLHMYVC